MIPFDASQHIAGIAQGVQNAMPGIQDSMKGDPDTDAFIDYMMGQFAERRKKGEPVQSITQDLLGQFKTKMGQRQPLPNAMEMGNTIGMNQGQPAIGPPQGLQTPISQPPNSFAGGAPIPQNPSGINAVAAGGTMPINTGIAGVAAAGQANALSSAPPPQPNRQPDQQHWPMLTEQSVTQGVKPNQAPHIPMHPGEAQPEPYEDRTIDLTAGRNPMSTIAPPAPPRQPRNRMQQREALDNIDRMQQVETNSNRASAMDRATAQKDLALQAKILKDMDASGRLSEKDKAFILSKIRNEDAENQRTALKLFIEMKQFQESEEGKNTRTRMMEGGRNNRAANRGTDKMPSKLKQAWDKYKEAQDILTALRATSVERQNKEEMNRQGINRATAIQEYNQLARQYGWPTMEGKNSYDKPPAPITSDDETE